MHILEYPAPCASCGRPTTHAYGDLNLPLCSLHKLSYARQRAKEITRATGAPHPRDTWEPGMPVGGKHV